MSSHPTHPPLAIAQPTQWDYPKTTQPHQLELSNSGTKTKSPTRHSADNRKRRQVNHIALPARYQHPPMVSSYFPYKVGGSLAWNDPSYIRRQADTDLENALAQNQFAYALGPRQIGKSSLRIHTRHRLIQSGYRCASVQATQLQSDSDHCFLKDLLASLYIELVSDNLKPLLQWIEKTAQAPSTEQLSRFVDDFLAKQLSKHPIVIFIDEIDALLETTISRVLFTWILDCYKQRADNPLYRQLNFVVLGSAIATDLPHSATLLAQGQEIILQPFQLTETYAFQTGFEEKIDDPTTLISAIYRWTNGQPFLTQKLCCIVSGLIDSLVQPSSNPITLSSKTLNQWVDSIVRSHIIQDWQTKDEPDHLRTISGRINRSYNRKALLSLYQDLYLERPVRANGSYTQAELILSGLAILKDNHLKIANNIYRAVFQIKPSQTKPSPKQPS